jgi:hypothetical protein
VTTAVAQMLDSSQIPKTVATNATTATMESKEDVAATTGLVTRADEVNVVVNTLSLSSSVAMTPSSFSSVKPSVSMPYSSVYTSYSSSSLRAVVRRFIALAKE